MNSQHSTTQTFTLISFAPTWDNFNFDEADVYIEPLSDPDYPSCRCDNPQGTNLYPPSTVVIEFLPDAQKGGLRSERRRESYWWCRPKSELSITRRISPSLIDDQNNGWFIRNELSQQELAWAKTCNKNALGSHVTLFALSLFRDPIRTLAGRFTSQNSKSTPVQVSDERVKVYSFEYCIWACRSNDLWCLLLYMDNRYAKREQKSEAT